jgi:hypothetical protein
MAASASPPGDNSQQALVRRIVLAVVLMLDLVAGGEKGIRSSRSDPPLWWRDTCVLEHEHEHESAD